MQFTQPRLSIAVTLALGITATQHTQASDIVNRGIISNNSHGLTSQEDLLLFNAGTIVGRDGAGVYAQGNGNVDNKGRITGSLGEKGSPLNDGIRIGKVARISNAGTIESTHPLGSGLVIGNGSVTNGSSALISGKGYGILAKGGGTTHVTNSGTIQGARGIKFEGNFNDVVVNSGSIIGSGGGPTIDLGGGDDVLSLHSGSRIGGFIDGGQGYDRVVLNGAGSGTLRDTLRFEKLHVDSGTWTLLSRGDFSDGAEIAWGAKLINQGAITGQTLVKGEYTGQGYTHSLLVKGTLRVNRASGAASIGQDLTLSRGSKLIYGVDANGGSATVQVGGTANLGGATLLVNATGGRAPVNSQHTLLRAGNVEGTFGQVTTDLALMTPEVRYGKTEVGLSYRRNDVALESLAQSDNAKSVARHLEPLTRFGKVTTGIKGQAVNREEFFSDGMNKSIIRKRRSLDDDMDSDLELAMADVEEMDDVPAVGAALTTSNEATLTRALEQLASSHTANLGNATLSGASQVSSSMLSAMRQLGDPANRQTLSSTALATGDSSRNGANGRLWVQGLGNSGKFERSQSSQVLQQNTWGLLLGADWALDSEWRLGVLGGKSQTRLKGTDFGGDLDSWHLGAYALRQSGPLALRLGAVHSIHEGRTRRNVDFAGLSDRLKGNHRADSQQAFAELGYNLGSGNLHAEPFVNIGYQRYHHEGFKEKGGDTALNVKAQTQDNLSSTFGARLANQYTLDSGMRLTPHLSAGWKHLYGRTTHQTEQNLMALNDDSFKIKSSALDRDSLVLEAGLDLKLSPRQNLGVGYSGEVGGNSRKHGVMGQWALAF
ncbi:autotransporter outer membrane beta-barrel domain-containing protein [Pseudomonas sp. MWU12-2345]|uniref:autotransporter outer membrane beta-barrel domain-containing protein n=1 Tax=Pseudomonas sp. MWU12-2345 TaxID=2928689 RepID=UPI00200EDD61|nr:autotransporter outer membrane beta-barrel domain-containing protein [Pseudomonas sp. MWU12-2345]